MNNKPKMIARIPIIILKAETLFNIDAIPTNTKLTPINIDISPELIKGKIMKINPKIMDNIPDDLLISIFYPPCFRKFTFSSEKM